MICERYVGAPVILVVKSPDQLEGALATGGGGCHQVQVTESPAELGAVVAARQRQVVCRGVRPQASSLVLVCRGRRSRSAAAAAAVFSDQTVGPGRDTAAGKSWEAWVKKFEEKKAAGEKNIGLLPDEQE